MNDRNFILEVIACTVEDAVAAEKGGADRLEIISRFDVGGLTPAPELVRAIKAKVSLPLRVMVRENAGRFAVVAEDRSSGAVNPLVVTPHQDLEQGRLAFQNLGDELCVRQAAPSLDDRRVHNVHGCSLK